MRSCLSIARVLSSLAVVVFLGGCTAETVTTSPPPGEAPPPGSETPEEEENPSKPNDPAKPATPPTVKIDASFAGGAGLADSTHSIYAAVPGADGTTYVALRKAGGAIGWGDGTILRRYLANGSVDASFATQGSLTTRLVANPEALAVDGQGRVLVGGTGLYDPDTTNDSGREIVVVRVTAAGAVDGTYGSSGRALLDGFTPINTGTTSLRVRSDGGALVVVWGRSNGNESFGSFIVGTGGAAVAGYGKSGFMSAPFPVDGGLAVGDDVLVPTQSGLIRYGLDGKSKGPAIEDGIVAAKSAKDGTFMAIVSDNTKFTLTHFSADGVKDKAFKGPVVSESFTDFEVLADGSVLLAESGDVSWVSNAGGTATVVLKDASADKLMMTADKKLLITTSGQSAKVLRYTL